MSIFKRAVLTRAGMDMIARTQANGDAICFTKAVSGSGLWDADEDMEFISQVKDPKQEFGFSGIEIMDGNSGTVVLTVVLSNKGLKELYYIGELGIYAKAKDGKEVLYALMTTDESLTYMPAENGIGVSSIVERINIGVSNASHTKIESDTGFVAATDFIALKKYIDKMSALAKGAQGQIPRKASGEEYDIEWVDLEKNVITDKEENFPEIGKKNAVYIDPDDASLYIWKGKEYFKLPLGAEAAQTLQGQITKNRDEIEKNEERVMSIEEKFSETRLVVSADKWESTLENDVMVYVQEIECKKSTEDTNAKVWSWTTAQTADEIVKEQKAQAIFFSNALIFSEDGKILVKCYKKKPEVDFGILIEGVQQSGT